MGTVLRLTVEQVEARREAALAAMNISLEEYRQIIVEASCPCCSRPSWDDPRWDEWEELRNAMFLLGE